MLVPFYFLPTSHLSSAYHIFNLCRDVGGCDKIRPLWRYFTNNSDGMIFVVDSHDRDRFDQAKVELDIFLNEEDLRGKPLLIFANKRDPL